MFRWFPYYSKKDRCVVKSKLLLLGSPYFYNDEAIYTFGKNEATRFDYLFKLMMNIHNDILNHLLAQNKNQLTDEYPKQLKLIGVSMSRLMRHVEVLHGGLECLSREQFQKFVKDINETLTIMESLDEGTVERLPIPNKQMELPENVQELPQ